MNSIPRFLILMIWALVVASETGLLIVLSARRAWRSNAIFMSFIAFCVMRSCLIFYFGVAQKNLAAYLWVWWGAYVPQSILLIALVLEVIQTVFRPYDDLPKGTLGNFVLSVTAVVMLIAAFAVKFPGNQQSEWITFLRAMDQGVSWAMLGVFGTILGFSAALGIQRQHRVHGIVTGFVLYLIIDVAVVTTTAQVGFLSSKWIWPLDMLAFLAACAEWIYCFARAEVPRTVPKFEEVSRIAAILGQYVRVIESVPGQADTLAAELGQQAHPILRTDER